MAGRPRLDPADDLGHAVEVSIDEIVAPLLDSRSQDPVAPPAVSPTEVGAALPETPPTDGAPLRDVLAEIDRVVVAHSRRNAHPGFFGYVCGSGLPTDPLAHALVAALNQNVTSFSSAPGAVTLERRVVRWLASLVGLPDTAGGQIASGGSIANLTALAAALHAAAGPEARRVGLAGVSSPPVLYVTAETHFCVERAAVVLGLGSDQVLFIPTDDERRMQPAALARAIDADLEVGARPGAIVATAGTTTTGAVDPLAAIADVAAERGVWLHVDAAYGGAAVLSEELKPRLAGIERADSVVIDLHKLLFTAFDGSALLLRDPEAARAVFDVHADYLPPSGVICPTNPENFAFFHHSPETSKRARALPLYLALRRHGSARIGRNVHHLVQVAEHLASLVEAAEDLVLVAPPQLSIVCFRWEPEALRDDPAAVDRANERIRERLLEGGRYYLSETKLDGRPVLRVCVQSHTTRAEQIERLVDEVLRLAIEGDRRSWSWSRLASTRSTISAAQGRPDSVK